MLSLSNAAARLPRAALRVVGRGQRRTLFVPQKQKLTSDTAKRLSEGGYWGQKKVTGRAHREAVTRDRTRVNIVSQELCDDIIKYIGPSLERHRGCDLVDLSPGAGLWSRSLHEFLEPRNHIMMDIDAAPYTPFLQDLLAKDNVKMIPKSGIVWKDLIDVLRQELPRLERDRRRSDPGPKRNDTLLMTANLAMYPKRSLLGFDNISIMVLHQLVASIRNSHLFQRYGLVRMLLWTNDMDKRRLLPRTVVRRKRTAFDAEVSCEWVHEVAGLDTLNEMRTALRDEWINIESACSTVARMQKHNMVMPPHRQTHAYENVMAQPDLIGKQLAGSHPPKLLRPFKAEFEQLRAEAGFKIRKGVVPLPGDKSTKGKKPARSEREKALGHRIIAEQKEAGIYHDLIRRLDQMGQMAADSPRDFLHLNGEWNADIDFLNKNRLAEFNLIRDNYRLFRQKQPVLMWDRRLMEPLSVYANEFFPNAPLTLLDIQPKAMRPIFRETGPGTTRSGDIGDLILRYWLGNPLLPIRNAMDNIWAGFGDLFGDCHSIFDPDHGGSPVTRHGAVTVRAINEQQWAEVLENFTKWTFCPTYSQLVHRLLDDPAEEFEEEDNTRSNASIYTDA
ncbi:hypothetical protein CDD82_4526 [Ophiocordyceps australis]|uniref:rRNA adenine N(6)-methyltransferase n=1 Tax=Ophiocordyceps australis TaxID=1399860 RepID=A0A2C5Z5X4_9HYPO|nr:hypothetical protein CDD82_4526 [Ophiocordyceps australis]